MKARIATLVCVHDDGWFLEPALKAIPATIDRIVFLSRTAWHGPPGDWQACDKIAKDCNAEVVFGDWPDETFHRREAIQTLKDRGYTHALVVDSDEVYEPELVEAILKVADSDLADRVRCVMDTYWQDPMHVVWPREALAPVAMIKLDAVEHAQVRDFSGGRELILGPDHGVIHHLSYAGPDERIKRKTQTWSHRDELVPDWWDRSWLGWKRDPTLRSLHPTHPDAYGSIERIACPEILAGAFGAVADSMAAKPNPWPTISVVVPVFGGADVLSLCLSSLAACADLLTQVIVVEDCTPESERPAVDDLLELHPTLTVLRNETNLGFPAAANVGAREATSEVIIFLNSDTIVPRTGLIALIQSLMSSGSIGAAGPMTNNAGYYQRLDPTYTTISRIEYFAQDLAACDRDGRDVDMLVGFCLAVKASVLGEVGLFDESFGRGLFEDTDLVYRIARAGFRLRLATNAYVHHWGSQSFGRSVDIPSLLESNGKLFRLKWARDLESGYASHLPGFTLSATPVKFDPERHPTKLDKELAARVRQANISLCMIVRSEERVLADCLRSAKPFFTQIVVIDTGSTDRTIEIAKEHGAEVHEMVWPDSFAGARNESLRHASGHWIFWMDADDTLPRSTGELIVGFALEAPPGVVAAIVPVQFVEEGVGAGTRVDHVKLFRNLPGLAFEGRIHEQILPALRPRGEVARLNGVVMHSGYDSTEAGQRAKRERDWKLLWLDLEDRPNHPFVLFNIGMTYHFSGQHFEAIEWLERCLAHSENGESHVRKAYALLGTSIALLGRREEALETLARGKSAVGPDPEIEFVLARLLAETGRLAEARSAYESMATNTDGFFSSIDVGILGFKRLHNLAGVCLAMGDYFSARTAWLEAIASQPSYLPSCLSLFDAALDAGDVKTAQYAHSAIYAAAGPSDDWADRGENLHRALTGAEGAEAFLRQACARHPRASGPGMALARLLCRSGRDHEAGPMLRGLSEAGYAEAAYYLGVMELRRGRFEKAVVWMRRSRDLNPRNQEAHRQVGRLEEAIGPPKHELSDELRAQLLGPHLGKLGPGTRRFSVVIVTFNSARTIETCLHSVLPTLTEEDEIVVVENHSSDGTAKLVASLLKGSTVPSKLVRQRTNLGYSKAANIGALASKGDAIVFLNPDTEVWPGWLERMKAVLGKGYAAVGPLSDRVAGDQFVGYYAPGAAKGPAELADHISNAYSEEHVETRFLAGLCLMVSRQTLDRFGLLCEETALGADDLELSWRLRILGQRIAIASRVFVRHEAGSSFASLKDEERHAAIRASDLALIRKLGLVYGPGIPSSKYLFGSGILTKALEEFKWEAENAR